MFDEDLRDILGRIREDLAGAPLSEGPPHAAFQQLLESAVGADGLLAGMVWVVDEHGRLRVLCERGMQGLVSEGRFVVSERHQQRLADTLRAGQACCIELDDAESSGSIPCRVAIAPLYRQAQPAGAVELFTGPELADDRQSRLLRFLEEVCSIGSELLSRDGAPGAREDSSAAFWERFERFTLHLQRSLDVDEVAAVAVNDGRVLLGCDRLSLALRYGNRSVIRAVSGQERVERRANLVRAMGQLAQQAIVAGEAVTYRGVLEGFAPQLEKPLADYIVESRARMVMLAPLREQPPLVAASEEGAAGGMPAEQHVLGCLIIEQMSDTRPRSTVTDRVDLVADHVAAALANARQHSELFLLPVWRQLGRMAGRFRGRRLAIAVAVAALAAAVGVGLAVVPWEYRVEGEGKAMPEVQREVFAPWDGDVADVVVESGARVAAGDVLLRIESDDLDAEYIAAQNEVRETEKRRDALLSEWQTLLKTSDREDQIRVQGELEKSRIELTAAQEQQRKLEERINRLTVRAPIDGVVATYQLKQNLLGRPVRRGELLLEVMDDRGPWRLELEVPEHRMGHVLRAVEASQTGALVVEYVPATAVEQTYEARLTTVATRSNESEERGTVVEVFAEMGAEGVAVRRIGAEVTAKIHCGKRSLGYALFGDVIEFVRRHVWF